MKGLKGVTRTSVVINAGAIAALFAVNAITRLIVRLSGPDDDTQFVIGLWSLGAMAVVVAVAAFIWTKRYLIGRVVFDGLIVTVVTSLLVALLGPLVSGNSPFADTPFGDAVRETLLMFVVSFAVLGVGAIIGALVAMALGLDPKSRAWKAQAQSVRLTARKHKRQAQKAPSAVKGAPVKVKR